MKTAIALCICVVGALLAGESHANMYGRAVPLDTSFGYTVTMYEWHAHAPYSSAVVFSALTNLGQWQQYPYPTIFRGPIEGSVGPVATGRWYHTRFYAPFRIFPAYSSPVYVAADICGVSPPREDQ